MLTHFQFKSLYANSDIPGWSFSFYYNKLKYTGIYNQDGKIEWTLRTPEEDEAHRLMSRIHELMLFHVYDNR